MNPGFGAGSFALVQACTVRYMDVGIQTGGCTDGIVANTLVEETVGNGVEIEGDRNLIIGSHVSRPGGNGYSIGSTGDGNRLVGCIDLIATGDGVVVDGADNMVRDHYSTGCSGTSFVLTGDRNSVLDSVSISPGDYNASIGVGATGNAVINNDFQNEGASGTVDDQGTGTYLRWPDDPVAGQNLTGSTTPPAASVYAYEVTYVLAGAVAVATSPPFELWRGVELIEVQANLGTAGTSDTDIDMLLNGVSIGVLTLGNGVDSNSLALGDAIADGDLLVLDITAAGTGAADLSIQVRAR